LKPARINSSGYRIYGQKELSKLQQILFYRELEMALEDIRKIMNDPDFNEVEALKGQHRLLKKKQERTENLLHLIDRTLKEKRGEIKMTDKEKFEEFKQEQLKENTSKYEEELKELYDEETIEASNEKFESMTEDEME